MAAGDGHGLTTTGQSADWTDAQDTRGRWRGECENGICWNCEAEAVTGHCHIGLLLLIEPRVGEVQIEQRSRESAR